jgi:hypothetical protein
VPPRNLRDGSRATEEGLRQEGVWAGDQEAGPIAHAERSRKLRLNTLYVDYVVAHTLYVVAHT